MEVEGKPEVVVQDISKFNNEGRDSGSRPVLFILGGAMRGVYGGGGVSALRELGLTSSFHTVVGVSTGAPTAGYFIAEQPEVGSSIYWEECTTKNFTNIWRVIFFARKYMSLDYVGKVWRGEIGKKRMNIERVRESKTDLLIAVTDYDTGSGELLRVNDLEDPVCPIVASCSIPLLTETKVLCGKKYYTDGAMSLAFPIKDVIKKVNPTSMLIFPNRDKKYADNIWVRIWESIMYYSKDEKSAKKFIEKQKIYDKELAYLRRQNIPYIIIWTDKQVSSFTMDKKKLKLGYKRYKKYVMDLFQKHL